jgi:L-malate glycosyltransferase
MKVLIITDLCRGNAVTLPERSLFYGLVKKGVDVTLITLWKTPETEEVEARGIPVIYIPMERKFDFKVIRQLREILIAEKFDILYLTFGKAITTGLIAARKIKVKIIGYIGSLSVHWHDPSTYLSFLNCRIDRMVCLSDGVMEHFLKQGGRKLKEKSLRIYKGYDPEWIKVTNPVSRASLNIPEDALVITCAANVRRIKGIPYLIKAADHLPGNLPVYFILVGKDMDSPSLTRLVMKSKYKDNFRVFGFTEDIFSYTSLCDVYIQPSLTEGLGRSIIEAMCLGKPVIVTEKGGSKELVAEGENGYVVEGKSSKAIAAKILTCYENRSSLPKMGEKSKEIIVNNFSPQLMIDQIYDLFCEVMGD